MTTRIFFDNMSDAVKISLNLGEPLREDLSIEVDPEELALALKQVPIKSTSYSIAEVSEAEKDE